MELRHNAFKAAIARGETQIGLWSSLCSPLVAEIIGGAGFDWILIDTEHSPNELPDVVVQLQALATSPSTPIVRPAWNDPVLIKRILDGGAQSLLLPFVQNVEEAKAAVAATRYPPHGIRGVTTSGRGGGFGRIKDYLKRAPAEICVLVQIETARPWPISRALPRSTASMASSSDRPTFRPRWAISAIRPMKRSRRRSRTRSIA